MLKIYDTLTKKKRIFKPLKDKRVNLYSCGPTVYNYAHLGNFRAIIFYDLLKRYLKYSGYKVKHIMNITDVDDKVIRDSQKAGKSLKEYTDFYLKAFLEDMDSLNIQMPDVMPRATEYIKEMVALIKKLEKSGYAYRADTRPDEPFGRDSMYFSISKFKNYGKLADLEKRELKENAEGRLSHADEYEKENAQDFVLWKSWRPEDGDVFWETELGKGRPGWHIECSAMAMKLLGKTFDIHCGGVDLIFPHHTNEIAQSEAATGQKFANYWMHNAHLLVDGQKMSKSLGNFYTLRDIIGKGLDPLFLRIILIKTHYRQTVDFSFDGFVEAKAIADKFMDFLLNLDFAGGIASSEYLLAMTKNNIRNDTDKMISVAKKNFQKTMDDDLNVSAALAVTFDFMTEINKISELGVGQAGKIKKFIFEIDSVFGFIEKYYGDYLTELNKQSKNPEIKSLLGEREKARQNKDYKTSDEIRAKILEFGIVIEDRKTGYILKLAK